MTLLYDPPSGWRYGFPRPYLPEEGESLEQTLLRDGYPQREIDNGGAKHCRFMGAHEELEAHIADRAARHHVEGGKPVYSRADFDAAPEYAFEETGLYGRHTPITVGAGTAANDNVAGLKPYGFIYLASPYSLYKHGFHMAARHASRAAACLMHKGLVVYCPIAHGHAIACDNDLPTTWEFWKGQCQPFIDAALACVVLKLDGWKESVGVSYEVDCFEAAGKPVVYVTMWDLELQCGATVEDEVRMGRAA